MSNKKKFEKNITKKLEKMYAASKKNPNVESRLLFVSGKYGFSVIRLEETPGSGKSFVDFADLIMIETVINALSASNTSLRQNIGSVKVSMYDGDSLARSFDAKRSVFGTPVDYAKMRGIDLDEASDRQRDNYVDHPDKRGAVVMQTNAPHMGLQIKNLYEQSTTHIEKLKQELKEAHEKAAEDYETIQKLTKEVGDLKIQIGKQNETIFQLKHPTPIETSSIVPVSEKHNELSTIVKDMNTKIDKLAEKVDNVGTKEEKPEKPTGPDYAYPVVLLRPKDNREIELEDEYAFRRLDEIKKPYRLRDIFKIVHNEMYTEIHDNVYNLLGEIENPITTQVQKFPRQAYALAIALAAPASYVSAFRDRLIKDYRKGDFVPTRKSCIPENFENLLECLYPEICRIQQILFHDINRLPYVYKKYNKNGLYTFYMIGAKSYDTPDEVPTKTYVAIPKDEEPYEYINLGRKEKLMYVLEHGQCMKKRDPLAAMNDCEYGPERLYSDYPHTLKDQIDEMIGASEETIITLDTTDPEEVYKTQLRYYPIYPAYTDTFVNEPEK